MLESVHCDLFCEVCSCEPQNNTNFTRSTNGTYCFPVNGSPFEYFVRDVSNGSDFYVRVSSFDFVCCPSFHIENTTFRKLVPFRSSGGEDMKIFLFCWAPRWNYSDNQQGICYVILSASQFCRLPQLVSEVRISHAIM